MKPLNNGENIANPENEMFAVHYKGQLLDGRNYHDYGYTRKGRVYTTIGPAKAFISKRRKWLKSQGREKEGLEYTIVRYMPYEIIVI